MEKLSPKGIALSSAVLSAVGYVLCVLFFVIAPQVTLKFFTVMFHGVDITKIAAEMSSVLDVILGFAEVTVISFVGGWLFALFYNIFAKKHIG